MVVEAVVEGVEVGAEIVVADVVPTLTPTQTRIIRRSLPDRLLPDIRDPNIQIFLLVMGINFALCTSGGVDQLISVKSQGPVHGRTSSHLKIQMTNETLTSSA